MKILIVTETIAGKGHEKAAEVLKKALEMNDASAEIKIISLLKVFNRALEKAVQHIYMTMIKRFPYVWHTMYKKESKFGFLFKDIIANIMYLKLKPYFDKEQPDLVIATHAAGIGALVKYKRKHDFRFAVAFTDFQVNSFWVYKEVDYYFVAAEEFKQKLISFKIAEEKIYVTGIPIDPKFCRKYAISHSQKAQNHFKILIMGGGLGFGGFKDAILALNQIKGIPLEVIVIAGSNEKLYNELLKLKFEVGYPLYVFSYVDDVHSKMANSHLLITKPGGLTLSEALAARIPILIYKPIPGQEEKNLQFLLKKKAAIRIKGVNELEYWVKRIYNSPKLYSRLKERQQLIAKPNSSLTIAEILINKEKQKRVTQK